MTDKMVEIMKEQIAKYSYCLYHSREDYNLHKPDSSLGSLEHAVSLYDNFESSIPSRLDLHNDMHFLSYNKRMTSSCLCPMTCTRT